MKGLVCLCVCVYVCAGVPTCVASKWQPCANRKDAMMEMKRYEQILLIKNTMRHLHQDPLPSMALFRFLSPHFVVHSRLSFTHSNLYFSTLNLSHSGPCEVALLDLLYNMCCMSKNRTIYWRRLEGCICVGAWEGLETGKWEVWLSARTQSHADTPAKQPSCSHIQNISWVVLHHKQGQKRKDKRNKGGRVWEYRTVREGVWLWRQEGGREEKK